MLRRGFHFPTYVSERSSSSFFRLLALLLPSYVFFYFFGSHPSKPETESLQQGGKFGRMTNTVYIRPIYIDESSVEGSETLSAAGHDDDDENGVVGSGAYNRLQTKVDFLLLTRMNCFAAHSASSKEKEEEEEEVDQDFNLAVPDVQDGEKNQKNEDQEALLGKSRLQRRRRPNSRLIISNPPNHLIGEQLAAGWPAWLSYDASEAIKGWTPRRVDSFQNLDKDEIWEETRSNLYKARDTFTGKILVLKKVQFSYFEPERSLRTMASEIIILRRMDHPNVIKLEGLAISEKPFNLYLVFEYIEYDRTDLTLIRTEPQVKCYIHQLLSGLEHCHSRGVFHRKIIKSNLLLDNEGILKITGFGSVSDFNPRDYFWYRAPELLLHGATDNDGVGVDLWSTGCILAELLAGKPIMPGRTQVEQLDKIFKLCGSPSEEYWRNLKPHVNRSKLLRTYRRCRAEAFKDFPSSSLPLIETLLAIDPAKRGTATSALRSKFFTSKPYACKPSSLPRKEIASSLPVKKARSVDD
ncbi:Protein kinase domain [Macleaya cordata]|uniref:Protein kinase domain n=1 Tax=Macleaya cordata TaxID=56857 RepID=A0A200QX26_MACCD|nr:Protein kinase domain [Macleaya cordata]